MDTFERNMLEVSLSLVLIVFDLSETSWFYFEEITEMQFSYGNFLSCGVLQFSMC